MREFQYKKIYHSLLTSVIVALVTQIHEYKDEQALFMESKRDTLSQLVEITKIQSVDGITPLNRVT